jgi:deoxyribose-phosphate aldolase
MALRLEELAKTIDQTMLEPDASVEDVETACRAARELHVASVCVLPHHVSVAAEELRGCDVKVSVVVGFPDGAAPAKLKVAEALRALEDGAGELEFAMNLPALREGDLRLVRDELLTFVRAVRMKSANGGGGTIVLKAIVGTSTLQDKLKKLACRIVERAEVDFAQTAKAAGGIETLDDVQAMLSAGAARIGSTTAGTILAPRGALAPVS